MGKLHVARSLSSRSVIWNSNIQIYDPSLHVNGNIYVPNFSSKAVDQICRKTLEDSVNIGKISEKSNEKGRHKQSCHSLLPVHAEIRPNLPRRYIFEQQFLVFSNSLNPRNLLFEVHWKMGW